MKLLVDTHVFLYLVEQKPIPPKAMAALEDPANHVFLSVVTPWEMQIKASIGKLSLARAVCEVIEIQLKQSQLDLLPVTLAHIDALSRLPDHHRDPFDRLLIAQAIAEGCTLISADHQIARYHVSVLWE